MSLVSLFSRRKKDTEVSEPRLVKPKGREQAIAEINAQPIEEQHFDDDTLTSSIEVTEIQSNFIPGLEDAAILYANGRIDDAANLLQTFLQQTPEQEDLWQMLFDLYLAVDDHEHFDQLALEYTIKREQSPPAWRSRLLSADLSGKEATDKTSRGQLFSIKGRLDQAQADRIALLVQAAGGQIQLDLSGIVELTPEGCRLLKQALAVLQKRHTRLQLASGALIGLLQKYVARTENRDEAWWLLLLELYQLQGRQAEFDDLAVDYAVTFGISPPSWEGEKKLASVQEIPPALAEAEIHGGEGDSYALNGVLGSRAAMEIAALREFAATRGNIEIDMSNVPRVEFAYVSVLMDTLMSLGRQQHQITIVNCNFMVYVLLVVMGVDQIASVSRRKF